MSGLVDPTHFPKNDIAGATSAKLLSKLITKRYPLSLKIRHSLEVFLTITFLSVPLKTSVTGTVSYGIARSIGPTGNPFTFITS